MNYADLAALAGAQAQQRSSPIAPAPAPPRQSHPVVQQQQQRPPQIQVAPQAPPLVSHPVEQRQQQRREAPQIRVAPPPRARPVSPHHPHGDDAAHLRPYEPAPMYAPMYDDTPSEPIVVAPRRPVFQMLEGRRVGQDATHAVFDWVNRGSPVQIQFIQGGGVSIERVTLNGRNVYDKDDPSPRVNFDPMLTVPSGSALLIVVRRHEGSGVSVQLGAFVSPSDVTTGGTSYADLGLEAITVDHPTDRAGGVSGIAEVAFWGTLYVVAMGVVLAVPVGLGALIIGGIQHLAGNPKGMTLVKQGAVVAGVGGAVMGGIVWSSARKSAKYKAEQAARDAAAAAPGGAAKS